MSQHEVTFENMKYVFGWDQMLQSFFLQVHDLEADEEHNPLFWYGTHTDVRPLYEVEDLIRIGNKHNLVFGHDMIMTLYMDKDEGR